MDSAREVTDGLWMIRQSTIDKDLLIHYCGKLIKVKECDTLLDLIQLRNELIKTREEVRNDE